MSIRTYVNNICINNVYKFPKYGEKTLAYTSKKSTRLQIKSKKIPWRYIIMILHKAESKEKMLNAVREKRHITFIKQ